MAQSISPSLICASTSIMAIEELRFTLFFSAGWSALGCFFKPKLIKNAPNEVRTRVSALRGPRPGPLDDGGERQNSTTK